MLRMPSEERAPAHQFNDFGTTDSLFATSFSGSSAGFGGCIIYLDAEVERWTSLPAHASQRRPFLPVTEPCLH